MVVNVSNRMIGGPAAMHRGTAELVANLRAAKLVGDVRTERRLRDELRARGVVFADELPQPCGATTGPADIATR